MRRIPPITALAALTLLLAALFAMPAAATAATATPAVADSHRHIVDLGTLGGPENQSEATAINDRGEVVGWSTPNTNCTCTHAFLWRHGKLTDLTPLVRADDINDHGVIVGVGVTASGAYHAFRWAHGKATDLGTLGGDFSEAGRIDNRGQILGTSTTADGQYHSFLWADGQMTDLAPLGAADINDRGQIVGEYRPLAATTPTPSCISCGTASLPTWVPSTAGSARQPRPISAAKSSATSVCVPGSARTAPSSGRRVT